MITSRYISRVGRMRGTIGCFIFSKKSFCFGCSEPLWAGNDMLRKILGAQVNVTKGKVDETTLAPRNVGRQGRRHTANAVS